MKVIITCFSAISNVASIVPQLWGLTQDYPEHSFVVLSRDFLKPLFVSLPNVEFVGADIRGEHAGIRGVYNLFKILKSYNPDVVLDMQRSWRTKMIFNLFKLYGVKTYAITSDRINKKKLIKRGALNYRPIKSIFERQADLYAKIGLKVNHSFMSLPDTDSSAVQKVKDLYGEKNGFWIGIAPFSIARGKTLPFKKMKNVISHFDRQDNVKIFLFGYGEMEYELLNDWQSIYNNTYAVYTHLQLDEELALMSFLDVMVSMDSANMHLASLMAVPVVSIWGATHPYAGFLGWNQSVENAVGVDFSCRPCTIHSDKQCKFGDYRCLESIQSAKIIETIEHFKPNN